MTGMKKLVAFVLLLTCGLCSAMSGNKKPKFTISVHSEGAQEDNPKMIFTETVSGHRMIFKTLPEFSHANIAAFHPFPAASGNGNGVALKLDFRGTNALEVITRTNIGQALLTKVNGHSVDLVTIDRPVSDGIFTIWSGVPDEVIAELEKKYPHINQSRSAGEGVEMTATTKKEKRDAMRRVQEEKKAKAQEEAGEKKSGGFLGLFGKGKSKTPPPPPPSDAFPAGPTTSQIPLEGGAATAQPRAPDPTLPLPPTSR